MPAGAGTSGAVGLGTGGGMGQQRAPRGDRERNPGGGAKRWGAGGVAPFCVGVGTTWGGKLGVYRCCRGHKRANHQPYERERNPRGG